MSDTPKLEDQEWYGKDLPDGREVCVCKIEGNGYGFYFKNAQGEVLTFYISEEATDVMLGALLQLRPLA